MVEEGHESSGRDGTGGLLLVGEGCIWLYLAHPAQQLATRRLVAHAQVGGRDGTTSHDE